MNYRYKYPKLPSSSSSRLSGGIRCINKTKNRPAVIVAEVESSAGYRL